MTTRWHEKCTFLTIWRNRVENHLARKCTESHVRTRPQLNTKKSRYFGVFGVFGVFATVSNPTEVLTCLTCLKQCISVLFRCFINNLRHWPKPRSMHGSFRPFIIDKTVLFRCFLTVLDTLRHALSSVKLTKLTKHRNNTKNTEITRKTPKIHRKHENH